MPAPVLYDVFAEAANRLVAEYSGLLNQAESAAEKEASFARIHRIRATLCVPKTHPRRWEPSPGIRVPVLAGPWLVLPRGSCPLRHDDRLCLCD